MEKLQRDYAALNTRRDIQMCHTWQNEDSGGQVVKGPYISFYILG